MKSAPSCFSFANFLAKKSLLFFLDITFRYLFNASVFILQEAKSRITQTEKVRGQDGE
jgi:hypothetical protein